MFASVFYILPLFFCVFIFLNNMQKIGEVKHK